MEFPPCNVDVFRVQERMDYPRDTNGNITAMVHPDLQVYSGHGLHFSLLFNLYLRCLPCSGALNQSAVFFGEMLLCFSEYISL